MSNKFKLDWNFNYEKALDKAVKTVKRWIAKNRKIKSDFSLRIRDMMMEIAPDIYEAFSRGDKCRVGRAISIMFDYGYFPELCRGKKKGVTNTYFLK